MIEGSFIVLEGIDGAGTTTQAARLAARFAARGLPMIVTHEPTGGPIGSMIRQALTHRLVVPGIHGGRPPSWKTMALLFAADRLDHLEAEILPNVLDGVSVVSDRYDLSSLAYQSAVADDERALPWIRSLNEHARRPDLTIVLDVDAATAAKRRAFRGGSAELYEVTELQAKLATAYARAEELVPGDRIVHVDGERDAGTVERAVYQAVLALRGE